jgi:hypothetical protein
MDRYAPGLPYDLVLSANGLEYTLPSSLVPRFWKIFVRDNVGYNLGAWDHAWRHLPDHDRFLFLQDESSILKAGWLRLFEQCFLATPNCGLVGEYIPVKYLRPWEDLVDHGSNQFEKWNSRERVESMTFCRRQLAQWGIPEGPCARHVTSVVQYTSRRVLELVDGYIIGKTKGEAITAEIGFSRKIEARGFSLAQVGRYRHSVVSHPQWPSNHPLARLKRSIMKRLPWA